MNTHVFLINKHIHKQIAQYDMQQNTNIGYLSVSVQYKQQMSNSNTLPVVIQEISRTIQMDHRPDVDLNSWGVIVRERVCFHWVIK